MILTAHQPAYLPWLGYFDKIQRADTFIYLETVQFETNSFINRNRIKTPQGPLWLTVPVRTRGHLHTTIEEIEIDDTRNWRKKHLGAIYANYRRAAAFDTIYPAFEALLQCEHRLLSDLCFAQLKFWMDTLGIRTSVIKASALNVPGSKSSLILGLARHQGASRYLSGALGSNYLDAAAFAAAGVEVSYQCYRHPEYRQLWGDFVPGMSILDFVMNGNDPSLIWSGE